MKEKILLFIPGYNCEKQIVRVLNQVNHRILQYVHEIIMVNNLSTDNTEQKVIEFIEQHPEIPLKLFRNDHNYGLGGSHKTAFNYAIDNKFDYVIVLHGDDQGNIYDLVPILENETYKKYDCCLGSRFMKGSKLEGYSKIRIYGNIVFNFLFSLVVRKRIYDLGSGLNMYSISMLRSKFYVRFPDNLIFNDCMILASDYYKHNVVFFPISWREEDQVSNVKMIGLCVGLLNMAIKYFIKKREFIKSEMREEVREEYKAKVIYEGREEVKL
ncbi:glycosyltransferase family 2 protein [Clostridium chromiireducens]|uniref:Glycosyltransferase family 2 protein n=1 Tax=Clostridium chromiireducens TaxID=225345 RepID=A0A399IV09_9CLOT|nr:glycosyltransferase family 2 protein [Clostridium chromiireducens]RII36119.1 glycosyltransferase family 2 protein [Clostridium chromiireducens]